MIKRGQVTIFVIIAIIIVAAVAFVFTLSDKTDEGNNVSPVKDPQGYIQKCAQDAVSEAESKLIPHGGIIEPTSESVMFDSVKIIWMCYTPELKKICTNKHPMLSKEIENQIISYAQPKIEACFSEVQDDLKRYDYQQDNAMNFSVILLPKQIAIKLSRQISFTRNEQKISLDNFNTFVDSPLYTFVSIALETSNQEVSCRCGEEVCNADVLKFSLDYPGFEVSRFVSGSNEKAYTITETLSNKKFNFGVRNCVRLP
jgi:hypothetical protein